MVKDYVLNVVLGTVLYQSAIGIHVFLEKDLEMREERREEKGARGSYWERVSGKQCG